jgi:hypothetical protein
MTSFVHGGHDYLIPVDRSHGPDGRGRGTYSWPPTTVDVPIAELSDCEVDVVILQRPHELDLVRSWLGREPGHDLPAIYLEHNAPGAGAWSTRHMLADQDVIPIVHVTHFNQLMWDNGDAPTMVIEHGLVDPGYRYSGELPHASVVINEPVRRGRAVGTDLLTMFAHVAPLDVFGIAADRLHEVMMLPPGRLHTVPHLPQNSMHDQLIRRRVYIHPNRWTSLGLSLLEAMHLGMPVIVLACTEAPVAVPPEAGCLSTRPTDLVAAVERFLDDPDAARAAGLVAREAATSRYGVERFLADWDNVLGDVVTTGRR